MYRLLNSMETGRSHPVGLSLSAVGNGSVSQYRGVSAVQRVASGADSVSSVLIADPGWGWRERRLRASSWLWKESKLRVYHSQG